MQLPNNQKAFVMITMLITTGFIALVIVIVISQILVSLNLAQGEKYKLSAQFAADSGLDVGLIELGQDSTWEGTLDVFGNPIEVELQNTTDIRTTYEIEVSDIAANRKSIRSTGRTYSPSTDTNPKNTRIFEIEVEGITASSVSIVTGVGGLEMSNSAKITDGSVFVNGRIDMSNTAQIGTSTNPLPVFVANLACPDPPDATYPTLCADGERDNPITFANSARIYGDVSANWQYDGSNMLNTGLVASSGVAPQALPAHDRDSLKAATTGNEVSSGTASCTNNGTKIWDANTHITGGDVTISKKCTVLIRGDVWIDGSLEMRNQGKIQVDNSMGSTRPTIMIDGDNGLEMNQSSELVQNGVGTNVQVVTYWSDAACSPNCSTVTGVDLANSQDVTTIDVVNSGGAAESIFYAKWSKVKIRNSVNVGALVAQVVDLENSATIAFSSSIPGFTPTTTWVQKGYLRVFL